jgi:hypothetical protein
VLLPTPPHLLQDMQPHDTMIMEEFQEEQDVPVAPPPLPILSVSVHSLNNHSLGDANPEALSITTMQGGARWNGLLQEFSQGRAAGWEVHNYILFTTIAPHYLPPDI